MIPTSEMLKLVGAELKIGNLVAKQTIKNSLSHCNG